MIKTFGFLHVLLFSTKFVISFRPIAIVTGGTRGIGSGISEVLAEEGYDLLLTYNTDKVAATKFAQTLLDSEISKCKSNTSLNDRLRVECVGGDISLTSTRDKIFERLDSMMKETKGSVLTVLVHNAGQYIGITADNSENLKAKPLAFGDGSLLDDDGRADLETMHYYQRMYGEAFIDLTERSLLRMDQSGTNGGGSIVGISSPGVTAHYYGPDSSYSMPGSGKCLMEYSMRIYASKVAHRNINVNVIVPGVTKTEAWKRLANSRGIEDENVLLQNVLKSVPIKRIVNPRDIGGTIKFLCSDVGKLITGTVMPVDGGLHLNR